MNGKAHLEQSRPASLQQAADDAAAPACGIPAAYTAEEENRPAPTDARDEAANAPFESCSRPASSGLPAESGGIAEADDVPGTCRPESSRVLIRGACPAYSFVNGLFSKR